MAKMIGKLVFTGIALTFLFGCAAQRTGLTPSLRVVDLPAIGSISKSELGDTLVSKGRIFTYDGIQLHNRIEGGDGFFIKKLIIEPQSLIAKQILDLLRCPKLPSL
jgi:butyrate kinase